MKYRGLLTCQDIQGDVTDRAEACLNPCYFLCLETKKVTKENSRLQIILGLLFFSLPTQYNSLVLLS